MIQHNITYQSNQSRDPMIQTQQIIPIQPNPVIQWYKHNKSYQSNSIQWTNDTNTINHNNPTQSSDPKMQTQQILPIQTYPMIQWYKQNKSYQSNPIQWSNESNTSRVSKVVIHIFHRLYSVYERKQVGRALLLIYYHTEAETKWPPFSRRHF